MFDVSLYFSRISVNFQWNMHVWCLKLEFRPVLFGSVRHIFSMWSGQMKSQSQPHQCVCAKKFKYLWLSRSSAGYQHVPTQVGSCRKKDPSNLSRKMWFLMVVAANFWCFSSYLMFNSSSMPVLFIHFQCQFSFGTWKEKGKSNFTIEAGWCWFLGQPWEETGNHFHVLLQMGIY